MSLLRTIGNLHLYFCYIAGVGGMVRENNKIRNYLKVN